MSMRHNVEQYLILLESKLTPEHLKIRIREALLSLGELADVVSSDPISRIKEDEQETEVEDIAGSTRDREDDETSESDGGVSSERDTTT
jgi:hypothetical protein